MVLRSILFAAMASTLLAGAAQAQDVVMRRVFDGSVRNSTGAAAPAPTPTAGAWSSTDWQTQGRTCGTLHQVRTASCSGGTCDPLQRPSEVQDVAGPQCVLAWMPGQQGDWSSTCSDSAKRSTPYTCTSHPADAPTDIQVENDTTCTAGGLAKPDATETLPVYSGCSSQWATGDWAGTCGPTAVSTRAVTCMRSGSGYPSKAVDDAFCDTASRPPATLDSSTADTYQVCIPDAGFEAGGSGWSASNGAGVTPIAHGGAQGLLLTGYSSLKQVSFPSVPGETLTASVWHKNAYIPVPSSQTGPFIALGPSTSMFSGSYNFGNGANSWINLSLSWKPTTTTTYLSLSIVNSSSPDNQVAMDDVVVIARRR